MTPPARRTPRLAAAPASPARWARTSRPAPSRPGRDATRRRLLPALAAATAALLLAACAPAAGPADADASGDPVRGGTLQYGRTASATSLDLHRQITANNAFAIDKIFEPLVSFDSDGAIVPWLAEAFEVDDARLVYTFTLRDGLRFSDGTEVTPEDVAFSLGRHLEVGGPLPLTAPIASIAAGPGAVTVTLERPYTPFLSELASFSNGVLPADLGGKSEEEFFAAPVGTGPFAVEEWDPNGDLSFVRNEHYWQEGKPYLDALVYRVVADDTQLKQQLLTGQIDAIETVPAEGAAEIDASDAAHLTRSGSWAIEQVFFNTQDPRFADPHVRRAIAHALDRDGITRATTFGTAEVANALIPPTIEYSGNDAGLALDYDVDAAKAELAESAMPDGFTATLLIASGNSQRGQIAQIMQESLAAIGVELKIEAVDLAAFRERFKAFDYELMINSGQSDAPDPNGLVTFQADPEGFSNSFWTHYTNERVTALMHEGRTTPDGPDREKIYLEIQRILADEVPYIPLLTPANLKGTTSAVHGFTVLPNGSVRFEDAWIEPAG